MTPLQEQIVSVLADGSGVKPIEVIARSVGRQIGGVRKTLGELERAGIAHRSIASGGWRLDNAERTRLAQERHAKRSDDLPDPPGCPPKKPRDGLPEPVGDEVSVGSYCAECCTEGPCEHDAEAVTVADRLFAEAIADLVNDPEPTLPDNESVEPGGLGLGLRTEFKPKCGHCTDYHHLGKGIDIGHCSLNEKTVAHYESHPCHSERRGQEPTDAELDAMEAEDGDTCANCERFKVCKEPDRDALEPVLLENAHPWCAWFRRGETVRELVATVSEASGQDATRSHVWGVDRATGPSQTAVTAVVQDPHLRAELRQYFEAVNELHRRELAVTDQRKVVADLEGKLRGLV